MNTDMEPEIIYERIRLGKTRRFRTIIYTADRQTFYVENYESNRLKRMYAIRFKEKLTKQEIKEAKDIITIFDEKNGAWKLRKLLLILAVIHAKRSHGTTNPKNIIKCFEINTEVTSQMISYIIDELGW